MSSQPYAQHFFRRPGRETAYRARGGLERRPAPPPIACTWTRALHPRLAAGSGCLRACYPLDIYRLVEAISQYEGRPVRLTRTDIDRAVGLYFAKRVAAATD